MNLIINYREQYEKGQVDVSFLLREYQSIKETIKTKEKELEGITEALTIAVKKEGELTSKTKKIILDNQVISLQKKKKLEPQPGAITFLQKNDFGECVTTKTKTTTAIDTGEIWKKLEDEDFLNNDFRSYFKTGFSEQFSVKPVKKGKKK